MAGTYEESAFSFLAVVVCEFGNIFIFWEKSTLCNFKFWDFCIAYHVREATQKTKQIA